MSSLPPYSTFRTDNRQMMFPQATSHGNILTFTPPGFKHSLNVKFPDSRLPVCERCKRNFKTRDMCRVRNAHTGAPWTTAFICITLDESCTDENGKYIDKPLTVRMVQWQPYCVKKPFDPKTPVCASCKRTNRTRSFCRERHKHRQLPWCTVYVLLSALDKADPNTVVAAPSELLAGEGERGASATAEETTPTKSGDGDTSEGGTKVDDADVKRESTTGTPVPAAASFDSSHTTVPTSDESDRKAKKKRGDDDEGDDINDIADSRTFLAKVSGKTTTIHWLELTEVEPGNEATYPPSFVSTDVAAMATMNPPMAGPVDPSQAQYYTYTAQQHQHALQSQQQYFFRMHQRNQQQYAAQHAAWQAHYQGQPMGTPGQPPPPPPPQQLPPQHQQHPGHPIHPAASPIQPQPPQQQQQHASPMPPQPPHMQPQQQQLLQPQPPQQRPRADAPASPPVTAGEAAAKRRRQAAAQSAATTPAPATPGGSSSDGHHQQQPIAPAGQQQQHQWAMYQPQMYAQPGIPQGPPQVYAPHPASVPAPPHGGPHHQIHPGMPGADVVHVQYAPPPQHHQHQLQPMHQQHQQAHQHQHPPDPPHQYHQPAEPPEQQHQQQHQQQELQQHQQQELQQQQQQDQQQQQHQQQQQQHQQHSQGSDQDESAAKRQRVE